MLHSPRPLFRTDAVTTRLLRPSALALCLTAALSLALAPQAEAAKKRKPAAKPTAPAVTACGDFHAFTNADWLKAHPVPANGAVSSFGELVERATRRQRELLDESARAPRDATQKLLGDFWTSGQDEAAIERDGTAAIAPLLRRIDGIAKPKDVVAVITDLHRTGLPVAFGFGPGIGSLTAPSRMAVFSPGGYGLPEAGYYTRNDADGRILLGEYNGHVRRLLALAGTPQARVEADAQLAIGVESRLAKLAGNRLDLKSVATKDLPKRFRNLQLDAFLKAQGVNVTEVAFAETGYFTQLDKLVDSLKPAEWQAYLRYRVADMMAPYLGKNWREADHAFRGRLLRGDDAMASYQARTLEALDTTLGPMLESAYVTRHLPDANRQRAGAIAGQVRGAMVAAIDQAGWMDDGAKNAAKAKLERLSIEIGQPARTYDFTAPTMSRASFAGNVLIAAAWRHREDMKRIGAPVDGADWDVAAYTPALQYDAANNRLLITAAILQEPVLDMDRGLAEQYGSLGAMVGHELTAIVAGGGSRREASAWETRIAPLAGYYGRFAYATDASLKVDGARTLARDAADLSGLELARDAWRQAEPTANASAEQGFFRGWARLWPQQLSRAAATAHAASATQAPGNVRTNAPLSLMPAFSAAFSCKPTDAMQPQGGAKISLWR